MSTAATIGEDLAVATAAGYLGTKVMEPVNMKLYERESEQDRAREDTVRPGAPFQIAAEKADRLLGLQLSEQRLGQAAMLFHYGLAVGWAPVYTYLRRRRGLGPVPSGLAMGSAMSLIADEGMTPAFGFSAPNRAYPMVTHLRAYVAHLVFGLAVAGVTEAAWSLRGRRP